MQVAVTGANSAVGAALLRQIAAREAFGAVAAVRRPLALADLPRSPRIAGRVLDYGRPQSLREALDGADCAVHLAGVLFERRGSRYAAANVDSARAVAAAAREVGVGRLVFISALGADPQSRNGYLRSKGEAERVAAGFGAGAAIIRTPLLLGPGTAGGRALLRDAGRRSVRVLGGGTHVLRPLDVDDLADAILRCCAAPAAGARTYELVGPTALSQRDLLQRAARLLGRELTVRSLPIPLARLAARGAGLLRTGGLTPAVIEVITSDETVGRNADAELGVTLTPLAVTLARLVEAARAAARPDNP